MDEKRLDRIEEKIDKLADAITAIARVEEKMLASNNRVDALEIRIIRTEKDLNDIAILARKNSGVAAFADKAFWLIIGSIIGLVSFMFKG
jgi:hypothetical protein